MEPDRTYIEGSWSPQPWLRTGTGTALDGLPKFDFNQFNQEYFDRLRDRVEAAGDRGIYTSVMLFEGWSFYFPRNALDASSLQPREQH